MMNNKAATSTAITVIALINGCAHVSTDVKFADYSKISQIPSSEKISLQTRTIILPGYYLDYSKKDQERYAEMNVWNPGFREEAKEKLISPLGSLKNDNIILDSATQNVAGLKNFKFIDNAAKEMKLDTSKAETLYLLISRLEYKEKASVKTSKHITNFGVNTSYVVSEQLESKATFALYNKLTDEILYQADVSARTDGSAVYKWSLLSKSIGISISDTLKSIRMKMKK